MIPAREDATVARRPNRGRAVAVLYAAAFARALATGMTGVLLGIYLAELAFGAPQIGAIITTGLAGAAAAALLVTMLGNRIDPRRSLIVLSLLAAGGGAVVALAAGFSVVAAAAFVGMINGMGRDRSASMVIDQALLPGFVVDAERTKAFAWYSVCQDAGHAVGALLAAAPAVFQWALGFSELAGLRASVGVYAGLQLAAAILYTRLPTPPRRPLALRGPRGSSRWMCRRGNPM